MKINELRWGKEKPMIKYVQVDTTADDPKGYAGVGGGNRFTKWVPQEVRNAQGDVVMQRNYSAPHFRSKVGTVGNILGPVGDWLDLMGATRADIPEAYARIKESPEYKSLVGLGFEDVSSPGDTKNGTFNFIGYEEDVIGSVSPRRERIRRKVLANGTVRTYAGWDDHHAGRGPAPHPLTIENAPHMTPVERIEHTVRASMKNLQKMLEKRLVKAFHAKLTKDMS